MQIILASAKIMNDRLKSVPDIRLSTPRFQNEAEAGHVELPSGEGMNMFAFWKSRLTDMLIDSVKADDGILIHLATEEYQHLFDWQRVRREVRIVQPLFYVRKENDLKIQAVWAKTCRGAMTRFIIENRITNPENLNAFSYEGFEYEPSLGEPDFPHFIKQ